MVKVLCLFGIRLMWLKLAVAIFFCAWHVYAVSKTLLALSFDEDDTAFLQRTLMVSTTMLFLLTVMAPDQPFRDSLFFVNSYFVMYMILLMSYITQSPYMTVIAVFACLFAISQSVLKSDSVTPQWRNYAPHAIGFYVMVVLYAYYSTDPRVDSFLDNTIRIDGIAASRPPKNNMVTSTNVFGIEGFVPLFIGAVAFVVMSLAYEKRSSSENYLGNVQVVKQSWQEVKTYPVSSEYKSRF